MFLALLEGLFELKMSGDIVICNGACKLAKCFKKRLYIIKIKHIQETLEVFYSSGFFEFNGSDFFGRDLIFSALIVAVQKIMLLQTYIYSD